MLPEPGPTPAASGTTSWQTDLASDPIAGGADEVARELAGRFTLSPGQIHDAVVGGAHAQALWSSPDASPL